MTFPFIRIRNCNCWCNNYSSTFCETDLVCIFAVSWTNQLENGTFIQLSILYSMIRPITIWFSFRMDYFHSSLFLDTFRFCISIHPFLPLFVAPPCGPACLVAIVLHFPSYSRLFLERFSLLHHPTLGPSTAQDSFFWCHESSIVGQAFVWLLPGMVLFGVKFDLTYEVCEEKGEGVCDLQEKPSP